MEHQKRPQAIRRCMFIDLIATTSHIILTFLSLLFSHSRAPIQHHLLSPPSTSSSGHCGMSPAEARSLGCRFDPISFSWLAPPCFDEDLINQFLFVEDWPWYLDDFKQHEVDRTAVLSGQYDQLYIDSNYHRQHCIFSWQLDPTTEPDSGFFVADDVECASQMVMKLSKSRCENACKNPDAIKEKGHDQINPIDSSKLNQPSLLPYMTFEFSEVPELCPPRIFFLSPPVLFAPSLSRLDNESLQRMHWTCWM